MARYLEYTVKYGDTLQGIAQSATGDVSNWEKIAKANGLVYPYIVDTPEQKLKDVLHLATLGDVITLPFQNDILAIEDELPLQDRNIVTELALGSDLSFKMEEQGSWNHIYALEAQNGDLKVNKGIDNLQQAIVNRLVTDKESLLLHPDMGSNVAKDIGLKTYALESIINDDISEAILLDSRVAGCDCLESTIQEGEYTGTWKISVESPETIFTWVFTRDVTGNFNIL